MGPGPANPNPRVLQAQALPLLGHMHPPFLKIMDGMLSPARHLSHCNTLQVKSVQVKPYKNANNIITISANGLYPIFLALTYSQRSNCTCKFAYVN